VIRRPGAMTTHTIVSPTDTTIIAACPQVGCIAYRHGWDTLIDPATDLGQMQIQLILSGRHGRIYRDLGVNEAGMRVFRFDPYQRCFAEHRTRPELFVVRAADTEGTDLGLIRNHTRAQDWAEDYHETLDRRLTSTKKG